ncbi:MAG: HipA domain-containing protein, partial [Nakamurella sp.]
MCTDPGDLVIDFTCGSGTTAFVAEQWGRRWITIDTSRVALALARQRLMGAKFPFYYLADSVDGRAKEQSLTTKPLPPDPVQNDIRQGFVYERVQHITLKSLANNPDIHEGLTRAEIDAAIKKHAEFEVLYDKPYEDKSKVGGDWIVKLPDANHAAVPCNEYAMMSWASQVGIDVPEVALRTRDELPDLPAAAWPNREEVAYVISRFDHRDAGSTSVHIEDLAQVKGIYPDAKYSGNFETIAGLIYR